MDEEEKERDKPRSPLEEIKEVRVSPISGTAPPREGQWKPGQSGNPGGRPKWKPLTEALQALLDEEPALARELMKATIIKAGRGDVSAVNTIWDRLEGKVPQSVGGSTELGPLRLVMEWEKE
jgi:hypothetical protein